MKKALLIGLFLIFGYSTIKGQKYDGIKFYENGKKKCEGNYKSGELISSKCWNKDGNKCECGERWIEGCKKD